MQEQETIEWKKCKNCGYLQHKSHLRCIRCKNEDFEVVTAKGDCSLVSYTILKAPPMEFREQASYAIGIVEFENGIKALGQITTKIDLKSGMKLRPVLRKIGEKSRILFEPII